MSDTEAYRFADPADPAAASISYATAGGQSPARPRFETGHEEVDRVLSGMNNLDRLPVSEHIAVFERVHRALQNVLSDPDPDAKRQSSVPRPPGPSGP